MPEETVEQNAETTPQEPMIPVSEGVTMSNDSADDALLDDIMGSPEPEESDDPSLHSQSSPHESGLSEGESSTSDVADKATTEDSVEADDNSGKPTEQDSDNYAKAVAALQRDGVPRSAIDQMAEENPQSLIDWGLKRAKVQADVDGYGAKVKELESKLSDSNETTDSTEEGTGEDQPAAQPSNPVETLNRYETEISEIFGDDAATAVMSPIRELVNETTNALKQQQGIIQQLYMDMERRAIESTRDRLGERFPLLNDNETFVTTVEQMKKLAQVGEYESMDDLMTDAFRMKFAEVAQEEAQQQRQNSLRETGQPTVTSQTSRPAMSKSVQDREDDVLDALLSGKGYEGASSVYNG